MAVLFALAAGGLAATALLAAAALRLPSPISFLLAAYVLASAELVVLAEALSLADAVGVVGYVLGETLFLGAAAVFWLAQGRPLPVLPRLGRAEAQRHPVLAGLAGLVTAAVLYQALLAVATPPNNFDSMTYRLSRAAAWLQLGGVQYVAGAHTDRQNANPPVSEMEILWTFAFLEGDAAAALVQLLAELALLVAVYGLARRIGFERPASLLAALLTATLTQVALQSVTTQNDLLVASFVTTGAYFLRRNAAAEVALAGLSVALALGTKPTVALVLPTLVLLAVLSLRPRLLALAAASAAAGFVLVGAYGYVQNVAETGTVLGEASDRTAFSPDVTAEGTVSSVARIGYRFVDLSGLRVRAEWLEPAEQGAERLFAALRIPINPPESTALGFGFPINLLADEDRSFFGPLGFLLVLPLALGFTVGWATGRTTPARGALALSLPVAVVLTALAYRYAYFVGRFMIAPVALTMPLAAVLNRTRALAAAAALLGGVTLVCAHAYNTGKPTGLGGTRPVWNLSRAESQSLHRREMQPVIETVDGLVPGRARLGFVLRDNDWDYPLYGPGLERRLVPLRPDGTLREAERLGLEWVVLGRGIEAPVPAGWTATRFSASAWTLLRRKLPS